MIVSLKIVNFLSFVGESNVALKRLSGIFSYSDSGLNDLLTAINYVTGLDLEDLGLNNIEDLLHDVFVSRGLTPEVMVEIVVDDSFGCTKFSRSAICSEEIFKIDDGEVSSENYRNALKRHGYHMDVKDQFLFSSLTYWNAMLEEDGLERLIGSLFGLQLGFDEKRKVSEHLNDLLKQKSFNFASKEEMLLVSKEMNRYQTLVKEKMKRKDASLARIRNELADDDISTTPDDTTTDMEISEVSLTPTDEEPALDRLQLPVASFMDVDNSEPSYVPPRVGSGVVEESPEGSFEEDQGNVVEETPDASLEENQNALETDFFKFQYLRDKLEMEIFCGEVRIAFRSNNYNKLLDLHSEILGHKEDLMAELNSWSDEFFWNEGEWITKSNAIGLKLSDLNRLRTERDLRLSQYGRLSDRIQCGEFKWIVHHLLGGPLSKFHIVGNEETALEHIEFLHRKIVEDFQTFVPLIDPRLRKMLFESGNDPISLTNASQLLELSVKLKNYGLLHSSLQLVREGGIPDDLLEVDEDKLVIFLETGEFISGDGTFGRLNKSMEDENEQDMSSIISSVYSLRLHEEEVWNRMNELTVEKSSLRQGLVFLEAFDLELRSKLSIVSRRLTSAGHWEPHIDPIYEEYAALFEEARSSCEENATRNTPEPTQTCSDIDDKRLEHSIVNDNWRDIHNQLRVRDSLQANEWAFALAESSVVRRPYIASEAPVNAMNLAQILQFEDFTKVLSIDDLEWYLGDIKWLTKLIEELKKDSLNITSAVTKAKKDIDALLKRRYESLQPFKVDCDDFFESVMVPFGEILEDAGFVLMDPYPFKLHINAGGLLLEEKSCNTFIRCVALTAVFVWLASLKKLPFLTLGNLETFCPLSNEDVPSAVGVEEAPSARPSLMLLLGGLLQIILNVLSERNPHDASSGFQDENNPNSVGLSQILIHTNDYLSLCTDSAVCISIENAEDRNCPGKIWEFSKLSPISQIDSNSDTSR